MSLADRMKGASKNIKGKYKQNNEYLDERKKILENLTMPQLKQIAEDFDIDFFYNEFINQQPEKTDFISTISASSKLTNDMLNDYISNSKDKQDTEYTTEKTEQNLDYNLKEDTNMNMDNTTINQKENSGNIDIKKVFDEFSSTIMSCYEIDIDLFILSLKNIQELKKETLYDTINKEKTNQLLNWFKSNKTEISTVSMPYTHKITEWILQNFP
jgi:hypothetical protein